MIHLKNSALHISIIAALGLSLAGCNDSNKDAPNEIQQKSTTINFTVVNQASQPLQGATVSIGSLKATTDVQGKAQIKNVENGKTHTVKVTAVGYENNTTNINVPSGQSTFSQQIKLIPVVGSASITTRIFDSKTGEPLANALITTGSINATSNATGDVTLTGVPSGRLILTISATGYANQSTIVNVQAGQVINGLNIQLVPIQMAGKVNSNTGGLVSLAGTSAQVTIAANSLVRVDGKAIVGDVEVGIALIDTAQDIRQMPGDLATIVNNQRQPLESFGAMTVNLTDASGAAVTLKNQASSNVRIPVMTRGNTPATVPLYYYDTVLGNWVADPLQVLTLVNVAGQRYYTGITSRFNTINADIPYQTINVSGCLQNESGVRLKNATVTLEGVNYSGYSVIATDANGEFSIPAKTNSQVIISGQQGLLISNTVKINTSTSNTTAGTGCLSVTNAASNVKVRLTWGNLPYDIDSHLVTPAGDHVFFDDEGSLNIAPYANLDVDDIDGNGPEIVTIRRLMVGTYHYIVNNYSETNNPGMTTSPIRVELNTPQGTQVFVPNAGESQATGFSYHWHSFDLKVDAQCNITVVPVRKWLTNNESSQLYFPTKSNPVYCTAK